MESRTALKNEIDYLEGLANYLSLQIVEQGGDPEFDVEKDIPIEKLKKAIENINNIVKENDPEVEQPPAKTVIE